MVNKKKSFHGISVKTYVKAYIFYNLQLSESHDLFFSGTDRY